MTPVDRFICRREGHKPSVTIFRSAFAHLPYQTVCQRCGQWIEVEPQEQVKTT
jgi:hypothetical protein